METWNLFTGNDIFLGLLGAAGLISMIVVLANASSNVGKREIAIKEFNESLQSNASDPE